MPTDPPDRTGPEPTPPQDAGGSPYAAPPGHGPPRYDPPGPAWSGASGPPPAGGGPAAVPVCVRHPGRETRLRCSRCGRPACPECLREASVGQHCVDCVGEAARSTPRWRNVAGASRTGKPVIVPGLIVVNAVIFALTVAQAGSLNGNTNSWLFQAGALVPALAADGELWRLVTTGFLHIGPLHLVFNMVALWVIGRDVEAVLGRARFAALYAISLLGGSAVVMLFSNPFGATAGASGAVFGLMGALVVLLRRLRAPMGQVIGLIAINVFITFALPGISWQGHLGGLVTGAAVTSALVYAGAGSRDRRRIQALAVGGVLVLVLALLGLGVVVAG